MKRIVTTSYLSPFDWLIVLGVDSQLVDCVTLQIPGQNSAGFSSTCSYRRQQSQLEPSLSCHILQRFTQIHQQLTPPNSSHVMPVAEMVYSTNFQAPISTERHRSLHQNNSSCTMMKPHKTSSQHSLCLEQLAVTPVRDFPRRLWTVCSLYPFQNLRLHSLQEPTLSSHT